MKIPIVIKEGVYGFCKKEKGSERIELEDVCIYLPSSDTYAQQLWAIKENPSTPLIRLQVSGSHSNAAVDLTKSAARQLIEELEKFLSKE